MYSGWLKGYMSPQLNPSCCFGLNATESETTGISQRTNDQRREQRTQSSKINLNTVARSLVVSASVCGLVGRGFEFKQSCVGCFFSALIGCRRELGVLWIQWEGWDHTYECPQLHGRLFDGVSNNNNGYFQTSILLKL